MEEEEKGEVEDEEKGEEEKWMRKRWRRNFTQTVKTKYMKTKQGCKKIVKQTWQKSNLFNMTKPIFLDSLLQEVIAEDMYVNVLYVCMVNGVFAKKDTNKHFVNKFIFSLWQGDLIK